MKNAHEKRKKKKRDDELSRKLIGHWTPDWSVSFISREAGYENTVKADYLDFDHDGRVKGVILGGSTKGKWTIDADGEVHVDFTPKSMLQGAIYFDDEKSTAEGLSTSMRFGGKYNNEMPWFYRR